MQDLSKIDHIWSEKTTKTATHLPRVFE